MKAFMLSLRQRKILYTIQHHNSFITGIELAKEQKVTTRTIRNDVKEINRVLAPYHASILSVNGKGYRFQADDPQIINDLNRIENALFSKDDRVFYLTFRLCLSDNPINLYDLEDEMFVSRTTLLSDLHVIKKTYSVSEPHAVLKVSGNSVFLKREEEKIRQILLDLLHKHWDYSSSKNSVYGFHFLDENLVSFLSGRLSGILNEYHILMEDPTLVGLLLTLAIMYFRVSSGHMLQPFAGLSRTNIIADRACDVIFNDMETFLHYSFPEQEKDVIYQFISTKSIKQDPAFPRNEALLYFPISVINSCDELIQQIKELYKIDFSYDDDFIRTLLLYIQGLKTGSSIFSHQQNEDGIKDILLAECEFSWLFQDIAIKHINRSLTEIELINLGILFSGALCSFLSLHPEKKLTAVLCCHEKISTGWALKRRLDMEFNYCLTVSRLIPVHSKSSIDFSGYDLIFTTVKKTFPQFTAERTLFVDASPAENYQKLRAAISSLTVSKIHSVPEYFSPKQLLEQAYWHENEHYETHLPIIETLASDLINDGIASESHLLDILKREMTFSFAVKPGIVFLYSTLSAKKTQLSVMTLDHRILWGAYKVRTIIMSVFRKEDATMLFPLKLLFFRTHYNPEIVKNLKSKEEILNYYLNE